MKNFIAHKISFESMTMPLVVAPVWSECASPQNQGYYGHNVTSPTNSDNNYYGSPAISPGSWNASSPHDGTNYSYPSPDSSFQGSANGSTPPSSPSSAPSSSTNHNELELPSELGKEHIKKNELDQRREKWANTEALKLMQETVGRHTQTEEERRTQVRGGMTARQLRQAAAKRYEEKTKLKEASKAENQILKPAPKLVAPTSKEKLASSTRQKKKPTPEEDYESIADFKCQLDIERERWAEKTALRLLYSMSGCA
jgi:hypothetical protein